MENELLSVAIYALSFGVAAFFIKKWMDSLDEKIDRICEEKNKTHDEMWDQIHHHQHTCNHAPNECGGKVVIG